MDTKITYEQARKAADEVNTNASTMQNIFDNFTSIMSDLAKADVFEGIASDELQAKFTPVKNRLSTYVTSVQEFSKEITHATDTTEGTERKIQQKAADLPDLNF